MGCLCGCGGLFFFIAALGAFIDGRAKFGIVLVLIGVGCFAMLCVYYSGNNTSGLRRIRGSRGTYENLSDMSGQSFEIYCGRLLVGNGYRNVSQTKASNDYGADLIATAPNGERCVFQCKKYTGKVDNSAVQEVVAAKAHYGATIAVIMTNSTLTSNARKLAQENGVKIYENIR